MKLKDILARLSDLGIDLSPTTLAIIAVAVPLLIAGAVWLYKYLKDRKAKKAEAGPDVQRPAGQAAPPPEIGANELRDAWKAYLAKLPLEYRRSILNFEHFVVLGTASSDTSHLVDTQTNWRQQTRQVAGDLAPDPALPCYLASGAVLMDIPARYLEDTSEACRKALDNLWRPLYKERSPTVVVALDVRWLLEPTTTPDVLAHLAQAFRMRVNQISAIRKKAVEVRVALTWLGSLVGFDEAARFWEGQDISARIELPASGPMKPALEAWEAETRAQLPRALTALSSEGYRKVMAFLRQTGGVLAQLDLFLADLMRVDSMSATPKRGGVYLCSEVPNTASPLRDATEPALGPDPRRKHLIAAVAAASAIVTYFGIAFEAQYSAWAPAADEMANYRKELSLETVGKQRESDQRRLITDFTVGRTGFLYRYPGFFDSEREAMREELSSKLREVILIPRLREVAQKGIGTLPHLALRWRRSLYYLGIIHSYEADRLEIVKNVDVWAAMTGLPSDLIEDYLANTKTPHRAPIPFEIDYEDPHDTAAYWSRLPLDIQKAMADRVLRPEELTLMKALATEMHESLARFNNDYLTLSIYWNINTAPDTGGERNGQPVADLREAYSSKFREVVLATESAKLQWQVEVVRRLTSMVLAAKIDEDATALLGDLIDRLTALQQLAPPSSAADPITLEVSEGTPITIDRGEWNQLLRDSQATLAIDRFIGARRDDSIFFSASRDSELRDVVWNPLGTDTSIFRGRAVLSGRYTKAAFEGRVKSEVLRLVEVLGRMGVPLDHKRRLIGLVRDEVSRYGEQYRREAMSFLRRYDLYAPSDKELRVALGVISSEKSTFDDFVNALDENTNLQPDDSDKGKDKKDSGAKAEADPKKGSEAKTDADPKKGSDGGADSDPKKDAKKEAELQKSNAEDEYRMLSPVYDALRDFASWHNAVGAAKGAPELKEYKEIAKQLLTDLQAASQAGDSGGGSGSGAAADSGTGAGTKLEKELTPAGRAVLVTLRGDKGSYSEMVNKWIAKTQLTADQQRPFLAPFNQLSGIGRSDLETVVERVWNREMYPLVKDVSAKFPFDRESPKSVLPEELTELFHPTDGKFFALFRDYLEPISAFGDGQPFRALPAVQRSIRLPQDMYWTVNAAAGLWARLWDEKGLPRKLEYKVATVPFESSPSSKLAPTVVYLNVGGTSVFNFNQRPGEWTVQFDWTKDENAQVGIRVTDVETKESSFPTPTVAPGPFWRVLRLLTMAKVSSVTQPDNGYLHEWELRLRDGGTEKVRARLILVGDPWRSFTLKRPVTVTRAAR